MPADLPVSGDGRGTVQEVQSLEDRVFAITLLERQSGFLKAAFTRQFFVFSFFLFSSRFVIREHIQLFRTAAVFCEFFPYHAVRRHADTADGEIVIYDAIKYFHKGGHNLSRGGGLPRQICAAVRALGD